MKTIWSVPDKNCADKAQLVRTIGEMRDRNVIAEPISFPSKFLRLRRNFQLRLQHLLIGVITWTQHHPMLAKGNGSIIPIGRDVFDRENRHCRPNITHSYMHFLGQIGPLLIPELEAWARGQRAETARGGPPRLIVELDQAVTGQLGGSGVRGRPALAELRARADCRSLIQLHQSASPKARLRTLRKDPWT